MAISRPYPTETQHQWLLFLWLLLLLLLVQSSSSLAQELLPGRNSSSFSPRETSKFWVSEAGASYTFGFKALPRPSTFLLAIWHSEDPTKIPIWWAAEGEHPAIATRRSTLSYNESSGLFLLQASPAKLLWRSNNSGSSGGIRFLNTGNLQVLSSDGAMWETFQDQRNTLMLTSLTPGILTDKPRLLQSTQTQTSYANGKFHMATYRSFDVHLFGIDSLHNQYVYMKDYNVSVNISGPGGQVSIGNQLDGTAYSSIYPELERLTLDYDGNLRVYRWYQSNSSWVAIWALLEDWSLHCRAGNPCGPFGMCVIDQTRNTFFCSCPTGYSPISATDMSRGCTSARSPGGLGQLDNQLTTVMVEQQGADFYYNDLTWLTGVYQIEECKTLCLRESKCIAATFSDSTCYLKGNTTSGYLVNGISGGHSRILLMKLLEMSADDTAKKAKRLVPMIIVLTLVGGIIICGLIVAVLALLCACIVRRLVRTEVVSQRRHRLSCVAWCQRGADKDSWEMDLTERPIRFSYQELVKVTKNFSHSLGEGGYGKVYKGWVKVPRRSHPLVVAVKVLKETPADKQFLEEVNILSKIHHLNLVSLHGFCIRGHKRRKTILVFEYMENGSLDVYLSPRHIQQALPWSTRLSIAVGTARGIAYLHHECNPPVLHCDIKPQNVLLDGAFKPKVADFGLAARFFNSVQSHMKMSKVRGTPGYIAPEWLKTEGITFKADVYSFGMLLLELIHGLKAAGGDHIPLIEWAYESLATGSVVHSNLHKNRSAHRNPEIVGQDLQSHLSGQITEEEEETTQQQQLRLLRVALWCIQELPTQRPTMSEVVRFLEDDKDINDPPNPLDATSTINSECDPGVRRIMSYYDTSTGTSTPSTYLHYETASEN